LCQISKLGEDILNHGQPITSARFSIQQFRPWTFDAELWKVNGETQHRCRPNICDKFHKYWSLTFQEITTNYTNEPINKHAWWQLLMAEVINNTINIIITIYTNKIRTESYVKPTCLQLTLEHVVQAPCSISSARKCTFAELCPHTPCDVVCTVGIMQFQSSTKSHLGIFKYTLFNLKM